MDKLLIKDLFLRCVIGTNDSERKEKQDVLINVELSLDLSEAARKDDLAETVNYREVTKEIIQMVENSRFYLVETLADRIAQMYLKHPKVRRVRVSVEKPAALRFARSVGAEISREK
jgi:FolB domain-containing protein